MHPSPLFYFLFPMISLLLPTSNLKFWLRQQCWSSISESIVTGFFFSVGNKDIHTTLQVNQFPVTYPELLQATTAALKSVADSDNSTLVTHSWKGLILCYVLPKLVSDLHELNRLICCVCGLASNWSQKCELVCEKCSFFLVIRLWRLQLQKNFPKVLLAMTGEIK